MIKALNLIQPSFVYQRCFQFAQASTPIFLDFIIQRIFQYKISSTSAEYFGTVSGIASLFFLSRFSNFPWKLSAGLYGVYKISQVYFSKKTDKSASSDVTTVKAQDASSRPLKPFLGHQSTDGITSEVAAEKQKSDQPLGGLPQPSTDKSAFNTPNTSQEGHDGARTPFLAPPDTSSKASETPEQKETDCDQNDNNDASYKKLEEARKAYREFNNLINDIRDYARKHSRSITVKEITIEDKKQKGKKSNLRYCDDCLFKMSKKRSEALKKAGYNIPSDSLFFWMEINYDKDKYFETHFFPLSMFDSIEDNTEETALIFSESIKSQNKSKIKLIFKKEQIVQLLGLKERLRKSKKIKEIVDAFVSGFGASEGEMEASMFTFFQHGETKCYLETFKRAT